MFETWQFTCVILLHLSAMSNILLHYFVQQPERQIIFNTKTSTESTFKWSTSWQYCHNSKWNIQYSDDMEVWNNTSSSSISASSSSANVIGLLYVRCRRSLVICVVRSLCRNGCCNRQYIVILQNQNYFKMHNITFYL